MRVKEKLLWKANMGYNTYRNPILFADYSDPDVIRVGDTFFMTASSFNYTPGLPILVSSDLVNWELKNYAVENIGYDRYEKPAHSKGIWAPSIRYHDDKFWITYGMPDEGIFIVHADNPLGKWSEPVLLLEGKGYIDPCPLWDDDGNAYIVHGYARSRIGFKSMLGIFPIACDGTKAIGEDRFIFDGTKTQPTIEGPKVYKRDGWYYIFAPAGGVKQGWQTVLRSRSIHGPYEERVVMHQGNTDVNGPHQGALVDTSSGEEWFIHFQDRGFYGRITHLQPVAWADGWPVIGSDPKGTGCGVPYFIHKKPDCMEMTEPTYLQASDDFHSPVLGLQWQWLGNHKKDFYSFNGRIGCLRLYSKNTSGKRNGVLWESSNVLTQKFICPMFEAKVKMHIDGLKDNEQAGCVVMGGQYVYSAIRKNVNRMKLVYVASVGDGESREETILMEEEISPEINSVVFRIKLLENNGQMLVRMQYSLDGTKFRDTGYDFVPSDHTWVGAKLGIFSVSHADQDCQGHADFEYVKVNALGGDGNGYL